MLFQTVRTKPNIRHAAAHRSLQTVGAEHDTDCRGLYEESSWRCRSRRTPPIDGDILISRWVDRQEFPPLRKNGVAVRPARYWCCAEDNATQVYEGSTYYI